MKNTIEKITARENLLSLPPEQAQKRVNDILFSDCWQLPDTAIAWDEFLPIL